MERRSLSTVGRSQARSAFGSQSLVASVLGQVADVRGRTGCENRSVLTVLKLTNFKSWRDPSAFELAPITGFFGANSSGKSSISQLLLLLKQTAESLDRTRVLHLGDERSLIDLGTFYDLVYGHDVEASLDFSKRGSAYWSTASLMSPAL